MAINVLTEKNSLTLRYVNLQTVQWVLENNHDPTSYKTEKLAGTLLQQLTNSKEKFSIGIIEEGMSVDNLKNVPDGQKLLFSNGKRAIYGSESALNIIESVLPDPKDRGAYGSLFVGECKNRDPEGNPSAPFTKKAQFNILVVDDTTGDAGGGLTIKDVELFLEIYGDTDPFLRENYQELTEEEKINRLVKALTGDCHGKINSSLAQELVGRQNDHVIQHRFLLEREGLPGAIAKGTFANSNFLDQLNERRQAEGEPTIDIIIVFPAQNPRL
jgi:hypothetical protein